MDNDKLLSIIADELDSSNYRDWNTNLEEPLSYYVGAPNGTEIEGRSTITSTDVADVIEWIMPQIMKAFTENNEVVIFDPVHEGDEIQADIESEYVYDVLMKQNDGFIILHQFIKDALLQRNGVMKIYYEEYDNVKTESFSGLNDIQLQMLLSDADVELLQLTSEEYIDEMTGMSASMHSVKISKTQKKGRICVESVPLEQFRINSDHNSVNPEKARFTGHVTRKTISDLRLEGFDEDVLSNLVSADNLNNSYRFQAQGETTISGRLRSIDESMQEVIINECYFKADINDDGIAEYIKVTAGGNEDTPTDILGIDEIDDSPWIATTPILMSHKFQGMSIFDRIKMIQDQKTSLWRNMMDNVYFQNNQRSGLVNPSLQTIEDFLTNRPGGLVRLDSADQVVPLVTPQLGQSTFDMMNYLDQVRAGRSGVTPEGAAQQSNIGSNVGSQGVDRIISAKEELVGLVTRVIAETGIKPACMKIRDLLMKHVDAVQDFQFRGQWVRINPAQWQERVRCSVRVGTGSGDQRAKLGSVREIIGFQQAALQMPGQSLVKPEKIYSTLDDYCKFSGLIGANRYFIDPSSPEGKQFAEQQAQAQQQRSQQEAQDQQAMAKIAEAEMAKVQVQMQNVQLRAQIDSIKNQLLNQKQQYEAEIKQKEYELKGQKIITDGLQGDADTQFKYDELAANTALELTKLESQLNSQLNNEYRQNLNDQ